MADTQTFHANNLFNVRNYICVITGGGTGIGLMVPSPLIVLALNPCKSQS